MTRPATAVYLSNVSDLLRRRPELRGIAAAGVLALAALQESA